MLIASVATLAGSIAFSGDATTVLGLDSVGTGTLGWTAVGQDPDNYAGSSHSFRAVGSYDVGATMSSGTYGQLHTEVIADSTGPDTSFELQGWQDFDVTEGHYYGTHTPWMRVGQLYAYVEGTDGAHMNTDFTGSMYIFSDHGPSTFPTSANPRWMLLGEGDYTVSHSASVVDKNTTLATAWSNVGLSGTGQGAIGASQAWVSSTNKGGSVNNPQQGVLYLDAEGAGTVGQSAGGDNYLNFNGFELSGGGSMSTTGFFNNGFSGNPDVDAD